MKKQSDLSKLFDYAGNYKYLAMLSWILSAVSALTALLPFVCTWKIIEEVLDVSPNFSQAQDLAYNGWLAVLFAVLSMLIYIGGLLCSHLAAFRVQSNIRSRAMHHVVTLPMGFMDGMGSGKMRKIINESSTATETHLAHQLPDRAGAIATPMGLLVMLLVFDWRLGLLSLIPVAAAFLIMTAMTGSRMKKKMEEYQNALEQMSNEAVEYVRGIPVVKTFGHSMFSFKRFKSSIDNYEKWVIAYTLDMRMPMLYYTTVINAVFAILIAAALFFTADGVTDEFLLNLIFYIIITPIITVTLNKIMYSSENKMIVSDAIARIYSIMAMQPLTEAADPQHPTDNSIELNKVVFRYKDAKKNALDGVRMSIAPGEHVALVGPSGGGKTTLASVVARFRDVDDGNVKIGGVSVKDISKEKLLNNVSFVFQDSRLLKRSIFENVLMARPGASREEVFAALRASQCEDIIQKLPNGIDTVIGAKGVYLSGGEQQRIAIARAMLKSTPILILDEATAFADPDNEAKVLKAFEELSKGKTVIMIAHRLSSITKADRIFVIKSGKIVDSGSQDELTNKDGLYAHMWREYNSTAQWKAGAVNA